MPVNAHVVHYLNAKLTAAGPAALPYEEPLKMAVRDQLLAVVEVRDARENHREHEAHATHHHEDTTTQHVNAKERSDTQP